MDQEVRTLYPEMPSPDAQANPYAVRRAVPPSVGPPL